MKIRNVVLLMVGALFVNVGFAGKVITADQQQSLTPREALQKLIKGNNRFVEDELNQKDHALILRHNAKGQHPFAFVFNCVDSRSVPDLLFDKAPGNIFVGRIAGNVVGTDVLGSMEFATKFAGAKLIVVMGHTACGAIKGACTDVKAGNLTALLSKVDPAVSAVKKEENTKFDCASPKTINAIAKQNVINQMHDILKDSEIIASQVKSGKILLVGAMHNIKTGRVNFFDINKNPLT